MTFFDSSSLTRPHLMAIINLTPDSFSGDGVMAVDAAVAQALQAERDGADILDLGAESTRPGATAVDEDTELARLLPVLRALRPQTDLPVSVDTFKARVAEAALQAGANVINDVWGGLYDPDVLRIAADHGCPIVLMHNSSQGSTETTSHGTLYAAPPTTDILKTVQEGLTRCINNALAAGVKDSQIILDPGIGFGKSLVDNLRLINRLDALKQALPYPFLLGTSRKGFIGQVLDLPKHERVEGTAATVAIGLARGADIVRVHDVRAMARVVRMAGAVLEV